jgi:hypothetical protein
MTVVESQKQLEKEYKLNSGINNSILGYLNLSPRLFQAMKNKEIEQESKRYFDLGDLIHTKILRPELIFEKFYILRGESPSSANQKKFCELVAKGMNEVEAYSQSYVIKGKSEDTIKEAIVSLLTTYEDYIEYQKVKDKKTLVNTDDFGIALEIYNVCSEHKLANNLLFLEYDTDECIAETPIYFKYKDIECKALPDKLIINHESKSILLIDLKTTGKSVHSFKKSFDAFNYDRQLAFYREALRYKYPGYNIQSFIVAVNTTGIKECVVYQISDKYLEQGIKKIDDLIDLYKYHLSVGFDYPADYYKGNGSILLDLEDDGE